MKNLDPRLIIEHLKNADHITAKHEAEPRSSRQEGRVFLTFEYYTDNTGKNDYTVLLRPNSFTISNILDSTTSETLGEPFLIRDCMAYFNELANRLVGDGWQNYAWFQNNKKNKA